MLGDFVLAICWPCGAITFVLQLKIVPTKNTFGLVFYPPLPQKQNQEKLGAALRTQLFASGL